MQRIVTLDTETTGLSATFHRIVEFGAVEVDTRTGKTGTELHRIINPLAPIPARVTEIHGIRDEDVKNKPAFPVVAKEIMDFVRGATIVIQNATFDVRMLDAEFERAGMSTFSSVAGPIVDLLDVSRNIHPLLRRHNLDSICEHFDISLEERTTHGALLDAKLVAATLPFFALEFDVWNAMAENGCAAELDRFILGLDAYIDSLIVAVDTCEAEASEARACHLAAANTWLAATRKWFDAALSDLIPNDGDWTCKHYAARWDRTASTAWKDVAAFYLSPGDLEPYRTQKRSTTYTPIPDQVKLAEAAQLARLFEADVIANSPACLARGICALRLAATRIDEIREPVRRTVLGFIDSGYALRSGSVRFNVSPNVRYKDAVEALCREPDLTGHASEKFALKIVPRDSTACDLLFAVH